MKMDIKTAILLLFGVLPSVISADEIALGIPISPRAFPSSPDCSNVYGLRCLNCTHLQLCANNEEIFVERCQDINPNAPYCSNNGCVNETTEKCDPPFTCTAGGFFPDITDCTRYFLCPKPGGSPQIFQCPPQFVYDSRAEICKRRRVAADCQTIDCRRASKPFLVFGGDKSIMVFCPRDGRTPVLTRCLDNIYSEYDENTLRCKFKCPAEGRFPDRLDCHKFYECYRSGNSINPMHQNCGPNFMYNRAITRCVPDEKCKPEVNPPTNEDKNKDPSNKSGKDVKGQGTGK